MPGEEALAFCGLLYGDPRLADEGLQIEIMSLTPGRKGKPGYTFCETTTHAAETALKIAQEGSNAYIGMSLVDPATKKGRRGSAGDAKAIVGFWADIDIADPVALKPGKNPPVDLKEAMAIAKGIGAKPSIVVHSGHGIHCYWLFKDPWVFENEDDRRHAADVCHSWENTLQQIARDRGRTLDSVGDLARVLRIPGTINTKIEVQPLPVRMMFPPLDNLGIMPRYTRVFLESLIRAPAPAQTGDIVKPEKLHDVEMRLPDENERARVMAKVGIACENDPNFRATWTRDRIDFASNQHSASEYEMSLAHMTMAANWSNQEIYWIMLLWREKHGEDTDKLLQRTDYVELTLAKAKKGNVVATSIKKISEITTIVERLTAAPNPATPEEQQTRKTEMENQQKAAFEAVSGLVGKTVTRFRRDGKSSGSIYYLTINGQDVNCGSIDDLMDIGRLKNRIFEQCRSMIKVVKKSEWHEIIDLLGKFMEEQENPYLNKNHRWLTYLMAFIEAAETITEKATNSHEGDAETKEKIYRCIATNTPYILNGVSEPTVWFSLDAFRVHVSKFLNDKPSPADVASALESLGAWYDRKTPKLKGKRIDRVLWAIAHKTIEERLVAIEQDHQRSLQLKNANKAAH